MSDVNRRLFLKLVGASGAAAALPGKKNIEPAVRVVTTPAQDACHGAQVVVKAKDAARDGNVLVLLTHEGADLENAVPIGVLIMRPNAIKDTMAIFDTATWGMLGPGWKIALKDSSGSVVGCMIAPYTMDLENNGGFSLVKEFGVWEKQELKG
jgi:hypothetical protein